MIKIRLLVVSHITVEVPEDRNGDPIYWPEKVQNIVYEGLRQPIEDGVLDLATGPKAKYTLDDLEVAILHGD